MQKEIENPHCSEDVANVRNNRKTYKGLLIFSSALFVVGILLEIFGVI